MFRLGFVLFILSFLRLDCGQLTVSTQAKYAILMNAETGAILYEKEAHLPCYPASTTKIATTCFALEKKLNLDQQITVSKEALRLVNARLKRENPGKYPLHILEHDGTMMRLKLGDTFSLKTLLYGTMLVSGNDAANALAEACSGSIETFVGEMNQFLKGKLGLIKTHFCNPHGLHVEGHQTTAFELAKITQYALKNPLFKEIIATVHYEIPSSPRQDLQSLNQHNRLLRKGQFFYPKAIGVKTGYHAKAGRTMVAAAEHEGRCLIAVLLGYEDPYQRYRDAILLFEKAFKEKKQTRTLFTKKSDLFSLVIAKANKPLNARLLEDIQMEYFPAEEVRCHGVVHWQSLTFPIEQGSCVGEIRILDDDNRVVKSSPIFAEERVEKKLFYRCIDFYKHHYVLAALLELPIIILFLLYYRNRHLKNKDHSSRERFSGRD